jgi:hypothetical protein
MVVRVVGEAYLLFLTVVAGCLSGACFVLSWVERLVSDAPLAGLLGFIDLERSSFCFGVVAMWFAPVERQVCTLIQLVCQHMIGVLESPI